MSQNNCKKTSVIFKGFGLRCLGINWNQLNVWFIYYPKKKEPQRYRSKYDTLQKFIDVGQMNVIYNQIDYLPTILNDQIIKQTIGYFMTLKVLNLIDTDVTQSNSAIIDPIFTKYHK